ncbi:MAG: hypothetical protein ACYDCH_01835 [Gaiellaceae bacterium]
MPRSTRAHWLWGPAGAMLYAAVIAAVLFFRAGAVPAACAGSSPRAVDLRVLLVGRADGNTVRAWESAFSIEGVPFFAVEPSALSALPLVGRDGTANFAATVVANPELLTPPEDARLAAYERSFGLRRVIARMAASTGPVTLAPREELLAGRVAQLTAAGRAVFPYLKGPVPIEGATGRPATPGAGATALVALGSRSLVTEWRRPDGVDELLVSVRTSPGLLHELLLAPGLLAWALGGVVPGSWQPFFDVHVDDVLLPSFTWIASAHSSGYGSGLLNPSNLGGFTVRMVPADVAAAAAWEKRERFTLDLGLNGYGIGADCEPLTRAVIHDAREFRWFNHTYQHLNFDFVSVRKMTEQIVDNVRWADAHGVPLDPTELVTGQHSGLRNPRLPQALAEAGIRTLASDASRDPLPLAFGAAVALPRHPMNVYQDAATRAEELAEFNYRRVTACTGLGCLSRPVTWPQFVARESTRQLRVVLGNDPRPSFAHESNLAKDRILLDVLSATLAEYRRLLTVPFEQPTMTASLAELTKRLAWIAAVRKNQVSVVRRAHAVALTSAVPIAAPLTVAGSLRWLRLQPGRTRLVALP